MLGDKVRQYLLNFNRSVEFFIPDVCIQDTEKYLPMIFEKRLIPSESALVVLSKLKSFLQVVDESFYQEYEVEAKQRIKARDINDWPVVAAALMLNCPVWTEDQDFFGTGIPTWTTDRVHLFFGNFQH